MIIIVASVGGAIVLALLFFGIKRARSMMEEARLRALEEQMLRKKEEDQVSIKVGVTSIRNS